MTTPLPAGQRERHDFPRFGLPAFANRQPAPPFHGHLRLLGAALEPALITSPFEGLLRVEQVCDFHCVTTWSKRNVRWGGVRFADFYARHVEPRLAGAQARFVTARGLDGYRTTLWLSDLLAQGVMLADTLNGAALPAEHGAPLRLVLPAHFGYKSVKHVDSLGFWYEAPPGQTRARAFLDHPRARVALEERGRWFPGWLLRYLYRPLIGTTVRRFARGQRRAGPGR